MVIGETAEIGDGCTIYQGVTLGGTSLSHGKRHPTLGRNVTVGVNSSVLGAIVLGDNAKSRRRIGRRQRRSGERDGRRRSCARRHAGRQTDSRRSGAPAGRNARSDRRRDRPLQRASRSSSSSGSPSSSTARRRRRSLELGNLKRRLRLKLYNTRTRSVEAFAAVTRRRGAIYVCGLTPSAQAHLGHARSFLFFDVLRRYLTHRGYASRTCRTSPISTIAASTPQRRPARLSRRSSSGYYAEFKASMRGSACCEYDASHMRRNTSTPISDDDSRARRARSRLRLAGRHLLPGFIVPRTMEPRAIATSRSSKPVRASRIDEHKEDPLDFALWKFAKPGERTWPFAPTATGVPVGISSVRRWRARCSTAKASASTSTAAGPTDFSASRKRDRPERTAHDAAADGEVWVHGGLLLFDNRKMAKSLGNFEPLSDLLRAPRSPGDPLALLQTGYRKVMNFTEDSITAAAPSDWRASKPPIVRQRRRPTASRSLRPELDARMEAALDEDMNTAAALAVLYDATARRSVPSRERARLLARHAWRSRPTIVARRAGDSFAARFHRTTATPRPRSRRSITACAHDRSEPSPSDAIERIVALRSEARRAKDWARLGSPARALRAAAIDVKDSKEGTTWSVAAAVSKAAVDGPFTRRELDFDDVVYGIHAVERGACRRRAAARDSRAADRSQEMRRCASCSAAQKSETFAVRFEQRAFFERLPFKAHQGVVAIGPPFEYASLQDLLAGAAMRPRLIVRARSSDRSAQRRCDSFERPRPRAPTASCCPTGAPPASTRRFARPRPAPQRICHRARREYRRRDPGDEKGRSLGCRRRRSRRGGRARQG